MHDLPLIITVAAAFTAAWVCGLLTQRLGLSPIVGYLLGGVLIGPHTPGFVADVGLAHQLAEVGVILLMFGVGLHFHLKDLLAVKWVAIPGAVGQSLAATLLGIWVFTAFGLPSDSAAVIGMAMAVASTVVLMRVLMAADALNSPPGHVAVGWLLVEDIFTVVVLVLIPVLAHVGESGASASTLHLLSALGMAMLKLLVLVAILFVAGSKLIPWALVQVARLRSRELFTLTVLVFSVAVAAASYVFFGASMALGAFLAGMVVAQSPVSHQAAADALPMRDAFAVLFFVSVGMLFDPAFLIQEPLMILAALGIILLAKPLSALVIVAVLGHSARTALTVAVGLAQIGEFSFILSAVAREHGLMPDTGHNVLVAAAIISIILNPLAFRKLPRLENALRARPRLWKLLNSRAERRVQASSLAAGAEVVSQHGSGRPTAIVVGFGPVGRSVHRILRDAGMTAVVIDLNMDTVSDLTAHNMPAIFGDASREPILEQAGMRHATHLILTLPHTSDRLAVVAAARNLNASARVFVRAHYLGERQDLEQAGATGAVFEEAESAVALARLVLADSGADREIVDGKLKDLRLQLIQENMSHLRSQHVRSVMVPWRRVRKLSSTATQEEVLRAIARHRFSRWPVLEHGTGNVLGYLLAKDLIAAASSGSEWHGLLRPLGTVKPDESVEATLLKMQSQELSVCLVVDSLGPVGLITIEDILEQVVGRIEDEYAHEPALSLSQSLEQGGLVMQLAGRTPEQVIRELAAAVPVDRLPAGTRLAELALEREEKTSTDLRVGVAVPHARVAGLRHALVVLGRAPEGLIFSPDSPEVVRLVFLLVTATEQPDDQLTLLAQLARVASDPAWRERLLAATTESEVIDMLAEALSEPSEGVPST